MDWLTFTSSVIDALAWPAAIVAGIFILRRALGRLIPALNQLKYRDLELRFGRQLEDVRHELESGPKPALPGPKGRELAAEEETGKEVEKAGFTRYFEAIAEVSPRAAILEAWIGFETTATSTAQALEIVPANRPVSMPVLIRELQKAELITEEESNALTKLRALRNEVVHGPDLPLSTEKAAEYASIVREISEEIAARGWQRMPKNC